MAEKSSIEWTNSTWNPTTGCTKISAGCDNCYAERFAERFRGVKGHPFEFGFDLILKPARLNQPLTWRKPRLIFVNSMSDLFHKKVPISFINKVFDTMEKADWHIYQLLTKRSSLLRNYINNRYKTKPAPPHIWVGVSIENEKNLVRLKHLKQTNATVRFISFEPLLGPINDPDLTGIDWVIVGGESGPNARPIKKSWVENIKKLCQKNKVAFFFKQWGGRTPKANGNLLNGKQWMQFPKAIGAINEDGRLRAAGYYYIMEE